MSVNINQKMIFLKKFPKQYFTLFEQLLARKKIARLYDIHVFNIHRRMQNPNYFTIIAESPSRWKHWNKSISLIHLTKQKRIPFQSYTVLQPYPLTIPVWRLALTFIFHLAKKRKSYFLFSGNHELFSLSYLFDEILAKKYNLNLAKAIDFWVPGFIGNRRSMILPVRNIVAHPPKSFSAWKLRAKTFSRKFRFKAKAYLKHIDTYRYLRDSFYPECIILLNSSKRAYAAGQEGYRKKLPTIALASSDSTNFGFSGSQFVLPAAVNLIEHLHYYCFLFFIVISFAKQQFTLQEHYKLKCNNVPNLVFSETYFNFTSSGYMKFANLIKGYNKLILISKKIYFNTIIAPFGAKLVKKEEIKLKSKKQLVFDKLREDITAFMSIPTLFDKSLEKKRTQYTSFFSRIVFDRIGQQTYKPQTAREKEVVFHVAGKKSCYIIYKTLKMFLSTFLLQAIYFKSGCVLLNENNITPVSIIKKNSLYTFTEKLVRLLLKKPTLFDISLKEIDWKFYTQIRNELLQASTISQVRELQEIVTERIDHPQVDDYDQEPNLKVSWQNFFNKPTIPLFLNRKLVFYDNLLQYKQKTIEMLVQYGEDFDPRFKNWLKQAFIVDSSNSNKVTKNVPLVKKFNNIYGFSELGVNRQKLPIKRRYKNQSFYQIKPKATFNFNNSIKFHTKNKK